MSKLPDPDIMRRQMCACGHSRLVHAGQGKVGDCLRVIHNDGTYCNCHAFKLPSAKPQGPGRRGAERRRHGVRR
jgi:hypothetical protein